MPVGHAAYKRGIRHGLGQVNSRYLFMSLKFSPCRGDLEGRLKKDMNNPG